MRFFSTMYLWRVALLVSVFAAATQAATISDDQAQRLRLKAASGATLTSEESRLLHEVYLSKMTSSQRVDEARESTRPPRNPLDDYVVTPTDYEWVDISEIGTLLPLSLDDYSDVLDLGFEFDYFGELKTQLLVASHGFVTFDLSQVDNFPPFDELPLPNADIPNDAIYVFWDDNSTDEIGEIMYYQDTANLRFIVSWNGVGHYQIPAEQHWFQVILDANGGITMNYQSNAVNGSCAVGIENADGDDGIEICYDGNGECPLDETALLISQADGVPAAVTNLAANVVGSNVTLTWLDPTTDTNGNPLAIDSIQVWWGLPGQGIQVGSLLPGVQTFTHLNVPDGNHTYYVRAYAEPFLGPSRSVSAIVGNPSYLEDFDLSDGMWVPDPEGGWEWGEPTQITPHSDPNVWGVGLTAPYQNGANWYVNLDVELAINSPTATVEFWFTYTTENWWDGANFQISVDDGATWEFVTPEAGYPFDENNPMQNGEPGWSGFSADWEYAVMPIGQWVGSVPLFRFHFSSDAIINAAGFYFDDMIIWGLQEPIGAPVSGTVFLDGGAGIITQATVRANGLGNPTTNPAADGSYTLQNVLVGQRVISALLAGYVPASQTVQVPEGGITGVNLTLRREAPPIPTNFAISVLDTHNGIITFNWDDSPDPLVDEYKLYRKLRDDDVWVHVRTYSVSTGNDTLPSPGIYRHCVTAVDNDASTPVESGYSGWTEVLFGELPPSGLFINENFDDHVRLIWLPPGVTPSFQLMYDDSSSEQWFRVATPNGNQDYFAVRFTPPPASDTVVYPIPIQTANIYMERSDPLPNVWITPDTNGVPNLDNPWMNWQDIGADGDPGWLIAHADGEIMLEDESDFWVVWQFPPGGTGPGAGSDANSPDLRSYWTWEFTWPNWNQWFAHDWMARVWLGGTPGWGTVLSVGDPSGYSVYQVPAGTTSPTPEEILRLEKIDHAASKNSTLGPVKVNDHAPTFASVRDPVWSEELPYSTAPGLAYQPRPGRDPLDQTLVYYIVYRDGADLAHPTESQYNDFLPENQFHDYYVTGYYDNDVESGPTSTVNAAANMAPAAPGNVIGESLNSDDIRISWTDPTINANGQPLVDLAGCYIYRDGVQIGTVGAGVQQFVDTPPQSNRTYTWTVRGIDEVPNVGPATAWSGSVVEPWMEVDYEWVDITGTGTSVVQCDDCYDGPFDLGFDIIYFGQTYSEVWICSNGWIAVQEPPFASLDGPCMPDISEPNGVIAAFWDDFVPFNGECRYYEDDVNNRFIISWDQSPHWGEPEVYTFQIIISSDGSITFNYGDIPITTSNVIGVENETGTQGIGVRCQDQGDFEPLGGTAIAFWGPEPVYANVTGTVTMDGGAGSVTNVLVQANGVSHPQTNPAADGSYTLTDIQVGNRRILASLVGYHTDTLFVAVPEGGFNGANLTMRRLNPPAPTNLTGTVNSANGVVDLNWDNSTDPLVDGYRIYRKLAADQNWIFDEYVATSNDFDTLTADGIWQYAVTAVDNDVTPPSVESSRSNTITVLYGELPPSNLTANGSFDDRIRLNWLAPGINQSYQILYDDSSSEQWFRVSTPNGNSDYFAVRFTPPDADTASYPMPVQTVNVYMERSDPLPNVWITPDNGGVPDLDSPWMNWTDIGADGDPGWLTAHADGDVLLEDDSDFWVVWQFPPGMVGPGTGSDASSPDLRSYWTWEFTWPTWNQWFAHDWMARVWLGGEAGWGVVLRTGEPSGYSVERVPMGFTHPTRDAIDRADLGSLSKAGQSAGPVRASAARANVKSSDKSAVGSFPVAMSERVAPSSKAPPLVYTERPGRDPLDELEYYKIFRNGAQIATNVEAPPYDDVVGSASENITYAYYVEAHYDNNQDSPPSNTVNRAANMAPGVPTNVSGEPQGGSQMRVMWSDPAVNEDGTPCVDLAGVRVFRDGLLVGTAPAGAQQYVDTPPEADQFYTWSVRAIDEVPNVGPEDSFFGAVQSPWEEVDYEWVDISQIGTLLPLALDDYSDALELGFEFEFFGQTYTQVYVTSHAFVTFDGTMPIGGWWVETPLPTPSEPNNAIYGFWDDISSAQSGAIYYYQDAAEGRFIASWEGVTHTGNPGLVFTLQIILGDDGSIYLNYQTVSDNTSCAIGVESPGGDTGIQICFDGEGWLPTDGSAIGIWAGPSGEVEGIVRAFGTNQPIEGVTVSITQGPEFAMTDASGFYSLPLDPGTYTVCFAKQGYCDTCYANILVEDDFTTVRNSILRAPQAQFSVTSISEATWPTHDAVVAFQITNNGGQCPLDFSISDTSAWLTATPAQSSVPVNGSMEITVVMAVEGLAPGDEYQSALRIQHEANGSPYIIPVTLFISEEGEQPANLPTEYALYQNYPNPFNASTSLRFDVPQESHVKIVLYNVMGQAVATVVDASYQAGRYSVAYEASDLPSGMYLTKLEAGSFTAMRKMLLLK